MAKQIRTDRHESPFATRLAHFHARRLPHSSPTHVFPERGMSIVGLSKRLGPCQYAALEPGSGPLCLRYQVLLVPRHAWKQAWHGLMRECVSELNPNSVPWFAQSLALLVCSKLLFISPRPPYRAAAEKWSRGFGRLEEGPAVEKQSSHRLSGV